MLGSVILVLNYSCTTSMWTDLCRQIFHFGKGPRQILVFVNTIPFFKISKIYVFTFEIWI